MCGQSVLDKVFVDKVCVDKVRRRAEEEKAEEEPGIQNQKQEPHTKMWGKIVIVHSYVSLPEGIYRASILEAMLQ